MSESIIIRNFGPVRKAEIQSIKKFTVIVGKSASGKSTVLKLLSLFRWLFKMLNIRAYLQKSGISRSPFRFNIKRCLLDDGIYDYLEDNTYIEYNNDEVRLTITGKKGTFKQLSAVSPENMCLEKVAFITEKRNMIPDLLANRMKQKDAPFYVQQLLSEFKKASNITKGITLSAVDVELFAQKVNGIEQWFVRNTEFAYGNYKIHLEDASSGIQTSAPLNMLVDYYTHHFDLVKALNNAVIRYLADDDALKSFKASENIGDIRRKHIDVHIEEPEICLYPDNQLNLINYIIRSIHHRDSQYDISLMFTTHSPYLLNHVNLLFKAYDLGKEIDGASLNYDDTDVLAMVDGVLKDLKVQNAHLINPQYLSEPLDNIYNIYEGLSKQDAE